MVNHLEIPVAAAFAKVNLALDVLGRLESGYHAIQSIIAPLSLADTLELRLFPGAAELQSCKLELSSQLQAHCEQAVSEESLAADFREELGSPSNLAARAVKVFLAQYCAEESFGFEVQIYKRIPFQAGLGGGSADAAAILNALARWRGVDARSLDFLRCGLSLGADVPALLMRECVMVEGLGGHVCSPSKTDVFARKMRALILKPPCGVSTPKAYLALKKPVIPELSRLYAEQDLLREHLIVEPVERFKRVLASIMSSDSARFYSKSQAKALTYLGQDGRCLSPVRAFGSDQTAPQSAAAGFYNEFQNVVAGEVAQVAQALALLERSGFCSRVLLAGSGSAVIGILNSGDECKNALETVSRVLPAGWFLGSSEVLL